MGIATVSCVATATSSRSRGDVILRFSSTLYSITEKLLGYFLTPTAKNGSLGASNIGVAVAFVGGGGLYAVLSSTVFRPAPAASNP